MDTKSAVHVRIVVHPLGIGDMVLPIEIDAKEYFVGLFDNKELVDKELQKWDKQIKKMISKQLKLNAKNAEKSTEPS